MTTLENLYCHQLNIQFGESYSLAHGRSYCWGSGLMLLLEIYVTDVVSNVNVSTRCWQVAGSISIPGIMRRFNMTGNSFVET